MTDNLGYSFVNGADLFYEGTDVPVNKLGIEDKATFDEAVKKAVAERTAEMAEMCGIPGHYNLDHLRAFHKTLLQDIFEDAGEVRKTEMDSDLFIKTDAIKETSMMVFLRLENEEYLKKLDPADMVERLAYYTYEIERLHPFVYGNLIAMNAFLTQLCQRVEYKYDLSAADPEELEDARKKLLSDDRTGITRIYEKVVTKIPRKK